MLPLHYGNLNPTSYHVPSEDSTHTSDTTRRLVVVSFEICPKLELTFPPLNIFLGAVCLLSFVSEAEDDRKPMWFLVTSLGGCFGNWKF